MVGELGSDDANIHWLLLLMVLRLSLTIWLPLVFAGLGDCVWSLPLLFLGCFRSPGKVVTLAVAYNLWGLPTNTLQRGREAADLLPWLQQISWEAFRQLDFQRSSQAIEGVKV